jgi:hypothetical protein
MPKVALKSTINFEIFCTDVGVNQLSEAFPPFKSGRTTCIKTVTRISRCSQFVGSDNQPNEVVLKIMPEAA